MSYAALVWELRHTVRTKAGWEATALLEFPSVTQTISQLKLEGWNKLPSILRKLRTGITWDSDSREARVNLFLRVDMEFLVLHICFPPLLSKLYKYYYINGISVFLTPFFTIQLSCPFPITFKMRYVFHSVIFLVSINIHCGITANFSHLVLVLSTDCYCKAAVAPQLQWFLNCRIIITQFSLYILYSSW